MDRAISARANLPAANSSLHFQAARMNSAVEANTGLFEQILSLPQATRFVHRADAQNSGAEPAIPEASNRTDPEMRAAQGRETEREPEDVDTQESDGVPAVNSLYATQVDPQVVNETEADKLRSSQPAETENEVLPATDGVVDGSQDSMVYHDSQRFANSVAHELQATTHNEMSTALPIQSDVAHESLDGVQVTQDLVGRPAETELQIAEASEVPGQNIGQTTAGSHADHETSPSENFSDQASSEESNQTKIGHSDSNRRPHDKRGKWYRAAEMRAAQQGQAPTHNASSDPDVRDWKSGALNSASSESPARFAAADNGLSSLSTYSPPSSPQVEQQVVSASSTGFVTAGYTSSNSPLTGTESDSSTGDLARTHSSVSSGAASREAIKEVQTAQANQRPSELSQHERVRLVQRISRSFARLGPMGGQINIKLHPPQLGALNVQVRLEGRSMTAKLSTESRAAQEVILESLPALRSRLAEQGFEIASFQVDLVDSSANAAHSDGSPPHSMPGFGTWGGSSRSAFERRGSDSSSGQNRDPIDNEFAAPAVQLQWQANVGIDLHV